MTLYRATAVVQVGLVAYLDIDVWQALRIHANKRHKHASKRELLKLTDVKGLHGHLAGALHLLFQDVQRVVHQHLEEPGHEQHIVHLADRAHG